MRSEWTNLLGFFTTLEKTWWGHWEGKLKLMYFISGWMKTRICPFSSPMIWYYFIINTCYSKMAYDKDVITVISRPCRSRSWVPDRKQTYSHGQSPWGGTEVFIIFCNFYVPSWNSASFSKFSCSFPPPPYTKLKLIRKNSGYKSPALFVGWGERLGLCELENAPEMKSAPSLLTIMIVAMTFQTSNGPFLPWDTEKFIKGKAILGILFCSGDGASATPVCMCRGCRWLKFCRNASRVFFFSCTRVMMIITSFPWYNFVWRVFIAFSRSGEWKGSIDRHVRYLIAYIAVGLVVPEKAATPDFGERQSGELTCF